MRRPDLEAISPDLTKLALLIGMLDCGSAAAEAWLSGRLGVEALQTTEQALVALATYLAERPKAFSAEQIANVDEMLAMIRAAIAKGDPA